MKKTSRDIHPRNIPTNFEKNPNIGCRVRGVDGRTDRPTDRRRATAIGPVDLKMSNVAGISKYLTTLNIFSIQKRRGNGNIQSFRIVGVIRQKLKTMALMVKIDNLLLFKVVKVYISYCIFKKNQNILIKQHHVATNAIKCHKISFSVRC